MNDLEFNYTVDEETGEIICDEPTMDDITKIGRRITYDKQELESTLAVFKKEIERIQALMKQKQDRHERNREYLMTKVENLLRLNGLEKLDTPAGKFKFGTTRESVNDEAYKEFTKEQLEELQKECPDFWKTTYVIKPDKKAIMEWLKNGGELSGFYINKKEEVLKFKEI